MKHFWAIVMVVALLVGGANVWGAEGLPVGAVARLGKVDDVGGRRGVAIDSLAFVDGGKQVVTAAEDGKVVCWDASTGGQLWGLDGGGGTAPHVAADGAGQWLAVCSQDPRLTVLDLQHGREARPLGERLVGMHNVIMSTDGALLATAQVHDVVRVWDVAQNRERCRFVLPARQYAQIPLAFSPDGRQIASGSGNPDEKAVVIFDTQSGEAVKRLDVQAGELTGGAHALAWSADGR